MTATAEVLTEEPKKRGNPMFGSKKAETTEEPKKPKGRWFGLTIDPTKTYEFETLTKSLAHRTQSLSGECKIFDPVEKRIRVIRYIPQASSIFEDEQDEKFTSADVVTLYFSRDKLFINSTDQRGVEYCLMHDQYDGVKPENRLNKKGAFFTLCDKRKYETELDKALRNETLALKIIEEKTDEELRPVARIIFNVIDTDPITVRNRLREAVKKPVKKGEEDKSGALLIINNITNPGMIRKYELQLAIDKGVIKLNNDIGYAVWGDTNNHIKEIDPSAKHNQQLADLVNFTMTEAGKPFYDLLKQKE